MRMDEPNAVVVSQKAPSARGPSVSSAWIPPGRRSRAADCATAIPSWPGLAYVAGAGAVHSCQRVERRSSMGARLWALALAAVVAGTLAAPTALRAAEEPAETSMERGLEAFRRGNLEE